MKEPDTPRSSREPYDASVIESVEEPSTGPLLTEAAAWGHVEGLLRNPEALLAQSQEMARLAAEGAVDQREEARKCEARFKRLEREEGRLIDAYQAEVISLDELGLRRRGVIDRRKALTEQREPQARLCQETTIARAVLADLTAFCERIRSRLDGATLAEKQQTLQLLIERVMVGEGELEIRHVIPLRGSPPTGSNPARPRMDCARMVWTQHLCSFVVS